MPTPSSSAAATGRRRAPAVWTLELGLMAAALAGRLPAFGAWWNLDDWGQLGRAAGLVPGDQGGGLPARALSQHWWWDATWPLFGLDPHPQALLRILLHGLCAVLVARIGRRAGLGTLAWFAAGLLFVATPLAFTPLYWASGIQELLAAAFALLAVERWLAGGRRDLIAALAAATLSMLAKESGLGLPILCLGMLWLGDRIDLQDRAFAWALTLFMLLVAVLEGTLVVAHFATGPGETYAMGGPATVLSNLGSFGWWLLSPGPVLASRLSWLMGACGATLFLLWGLWAVFMARAGHLLPGGALVAALLVLGPALPLRTQVNPYLAYLAVAPLALALACLVPGRWAARTGLMAGLLAVAALWSFVGMQARAGARNEMGFPADPVVRATSLSWDTARLVRAWAPRAHPTAPDSTAHLVLLQVPVTADDAESSGRIGPRWVRRSEVFEACGGVVGPTLACAGAARIDWLSALTEAPAEAIVLAETATGFKVWGPTPNALLYAVLTDVGLGHFERARLHLLRAGQLQPDSMNFVYDEGQMIIPAAMALQNQRPFIDWTVRQLQEGRSRFEVGGLQAMFLQVLCVCTGKTVEELSAGSTTVFPPAAR